MSINVPAFLSTLPVMGKCMAGIFIVTAVIVVVMMILGKIKDGKNADEK